MDNYIGTKLDNRYEVCDLIGVGGMANVYRGYDSLENREVAIKILKSEYYENEEFLRRFRNESRAIAMLSHENIVKIYDVSFTEKAHFIVMELINGITLKEYIAQQVILDWKEATYYTMQVLKALNHAHDNGIVHRDIKPQNVMLLSDGTIKITDFGIARFSRSETKTITDKAIGSVHYISPEQASGADIDQRTDLYSVGVMLFEMLTGKLPFDSETPISVALQQIQEEPIKPRELNPDIPEALEQIVMRAMQKNPSKRYQTAAEMLKDFEDFKKNPYVTFNYQYTDNDTATVSNSVNEPVINKSNENISEHNQKGRIAMKKRKRPSEKSEKVEYVVVDRTPIIPILAGVTTAFVLVAALFIGIMFYKNNPFKTNDDIKVPKLVGFQYESLKDMQNVMKNFIIQVETTDYNPSYEKGTIYDQKPSEGKTVKVGSVIKIKVSGGQKIVKIPDVVNLDSESAYSTLKREGLEYTIIESFHEEVPLGSVIYIEPAAGSQVPAGTNISVYISLGPENKIAPVPNIKGMKITDAETLLQNYKLKIGGQTYQESDLPRGTVIAQDPEENAQISEGSYVNVVLSQGTDKPTKLRLPIKLPDIDRTVKIKAMVNGVVTEQEMLNPSEVKVWEPVFSGFDEVNIQIIIDNKKYMEYSLNFNEKTYSVLENLSGEFN